MLMRLLVLSSVALVATGCANKNSAEEPYTPAADSSYNNGNYNNGYAGSNVYSSNSGPSYRSTVAPTAQLEPGGINDYPPGTFSDYDEKQAQTSTSVSSDGSVVTVNNRTGARTTGGGAAYTQGYGNYAGSGGTYVVAKGDTFFALARRFYQDEARWRDIWNANRARVPNKDRLPVGLKLIIP